MALRWYGRNWQRQRAGLSRSRAHNHSMIGPPRAGRSCARPRARHRTTLHAEKQHIAPLPCARAWRTTACVWLTARYASGRASNSDAWRHPSLTAAPRTRLQATIWPPDVPSDRDWKRRQPSRSASSTNKPCIRRRSARQYHRRAPVHGNAACRVERNHNAEYAGLNSVRFPPSRISA